MCILFLVYQHIDIWYYYIINVTDFTQLLHLLLSHCNDNKTEIVYSENEQNQNPRYQLHD